MIVKVVLFYGRIRIIDATSIALDENGNDFLFVKDVTNKVFRFGFRKLKRVHIINHDGAEKVLYPN